MDGLELGLQDVYGWAFFLLGLLNCFWLGLLDCFWLWLDLLDVGIER
jgi:hypothetical protein